MDLDLIVNVFGANINYVCAVGEANLLDFEVCLPRLDEFQRLDRAVIQRGNWAFTPDDLPPWFPNSLDGAWRIALITERSLEPNSDDPYRSLDDPYLYYFRLNGYWVALRQLRRLIQEHIRGGIPVDPVTAIINMIYNGDVLEYSTDLPISSSLYDLGKQTVQYIVGGPAHNEQTEIRRVLFVLSLHRTDEGYNDWHHRCVGLANALGLDEMVLAIDDILYGVNIGERYELLCCCGPDLLPGMRDRFFDALINLVNATNPRIALLLMPKTARAENYGRVVRPLGYAQLLVASGVPHCFALSRYVPVQGRQHLLNRLSGGLERCRPIIDTNLVRCISHVIRDSARTYLPGRVGGRVSDYGIQTIEHTEIAAMSTVLVSSNRIP